MGRKPAFVLSAALFLIAPLFAPAAAAQGSARDSHAIAAMELRGEALAAYDSGDYDGAAELARRAKAELAFIQAASPAAKAEAALPASYRVRLVPEDRDSLSKIAGYPFVYGDREKWIVLYRANKDVLKHPEDEDLILPDEILAIPSIAGEVREGEWSDTSLYPVFASSVR